MGAELTSVGAARRWLPEVESVRAFAYACIVFNHVGGVFFDLPGGASAMVWYAPLLAITRPALPAFMAVSGVLMGLRVARPRHGSITGLKRVLATYMTWTIVYVVALKVLGGTGPLMAQDLAGEIGTALLTGRAMYHLWYMLIAIQIVILAPVVAELLVGKSLRFQLITLAYVVAINVVLLGQIGGPLADIGGAGRVVFSLAYDRIVFFWIAYVVLGVVVGLNYDRVMEVLQRRAVWVLGTYALSVGLMVALVVDRVALFGGNPWLSTDVSVVMRAWIVPFEMLTIVAWMLIGVYVVRTRVAQLITVVGAVSLGGFLIHPLVLHVLREYVFARWPTANPTLTFLALFALTLSISTGLSWLLARSHLSFGTTLVGAPPARGTPEPAPAVDGDEDRAATGAIEAVAARDP